MVSKPKITKRTGEINQTTTTQPSVSPLLIYVAALQAGEVTSSFYNDNNEDNQVPTLQFLDPERPFSCLSVLHTKGSCKFSWKKQHILDKARALSITGLTGIREKGADSGSKLTNQEW